MFKIFVIIQRKDKEGKIVIVSEEGIKVNGEKYSLLNLHALEAWNMGYVKVKYGRSEEIVPLGKIVFRFKDGGELSIEALNPIDLTDRLVIWLNNIHRSNNEPIFIQKDLSGEHVSYSRE